MSAKDFHYCRPPFFVNFQSSGNFSFRLTVPYLDLTEPTQINQLVRYN